MATVPPQGDDSSSRIVVRRSHGDGVISGPDPSHSCREEGPGNTLKSKLSPGRNVGLTNQKH